MIVCSRCLLELIDVITTPEMTGGYYRADGWPEFSNEGEINICDKCMHTDPRYIAIYG